ncbi:hypothetical protein QYE76_026137 [Lolium multiflorum]|uniref:CCHC-type domain-containing protein n=1 Tax=Lolium multiflorum TaxID=4521 RepID=A0AAD8RGX4_LOLMU|nr:hypothetical protein QYE76_026137 [Lolium multiflorum]
MPSVTPKDKSTVNCYECGVVGHYSNECPNKLAKIAANTAALPRRRFAGRRNRTTTTAALPHDARRSTPPCQAGSDIFRDAAYAPAPARIPVLSNHLIDDTHRRRRAYGGTYDMQGYRPATIAGEYQRRRHETIPCRRSAQPLAVPSIGSVLSRSRAGSSSSLRLHRRPDPSDDNWGLEAKEEPTPPPVKIVNGVNFVDNDEVKTGTVKKL